MLVRKKKTFPGLSFNMNSNPSSLKPCFSHSSSFIFCCPHYWNHHLTDLFAFGHFSFISNPCFTMHQHLLVKQRLYLLKILTSIFSNYIIKHSNMPLGCPRLSVILSQLSLPPHLHTGPSVLPPPCQTIHNCSTEDSDTICRLPRSAMSLSLSDTSEILPP